MITDTTELVTACKNLLQVSLVYTKKTTGETVNHVGGIYEIKSAAGCFYLWDTSLNNSIRKFLFSNVESFQVLAIPFVRTMPWPIKIDDIVIVP